MSAAQRYAAAERVPHIMATPTVPIPKALQTFPDIIAQVLARRAVRGPEQVDGDLQKLPPPRHWPGLEAACPVLAKALAERKRFVVVGDFDADGATASALAKLVLQAMGAEQVEIVIPDRQTQGYGLSPALLQAHPVGPQDCVLTVDNGIAAFAGVQAAQQAGAQVVITDHHLPAEQWPQADAVVNPNLPDVGFPGQHLAGVGVVFYLFARLRRYLEQHGWFDSARPAPNLAQYLDLVALGTVADVVRLDEINRRLVAQGLACIRRGQGRLGILSLFAVAGRDYQRACAADLGFAIGPRLNAAGRLTHMQQGVDCLLSERPEQARQYAQQLHQTNQARQEVEQGMLDQALESVAAVAGQQCPDDPAQWVQYGADYHPGVVGLLAGRLKSRWLRPVFVFAPENPEDPQTLLKGSGRSIPGVHLRDLLVWIDNRHPGLIQGFGGHAMAAGLTLPKAHLTDFKTRFAEAIAAVNVTFASVDTVWVDGALSKSQLDLRFYQQIQRIGPFGTGFEEPVFANTFHVDSVTALKGGKHLRLRLKLADTDMQPINAIWFNAPQTPPPGRQWQVAYRLDNNVFRGQEQLQLVVQSALPVS